MNLLFVCEDAGAAAALAPVAERLETRGASLAFWLGPVATPRFAGVRGTRWDGSGSIDAVVSRAEGVVTGSSCWGERLEARAVTAARRCHRPVATFVDFWSNYLPRLSYPTPNGLELLPDRLFVVDRIMKADLMALGVADALVEVTGSPAFDSVLARPPLPMPEPRRVLFVSQPIESQYGETLGYTERSVLQALKRACSAAGADIFVRPHPREDRAALARFDVTFDDSPSLDEAIGRASVVVGMTTMALVEAALRGRPALSVQFGRVDPDGLPTNRSGLTREIETEEELAAAIGGALRGEARADRDLGLLGWRPGSTTRVAEAILRMVGQPEG